MCSLVDENMYLGCVYKPNKTGLHDLQCSKVGKELGVSLSGS